MCQNVKCDFPKEKFKNVENVGKCQNVSMSNVRGSKCRNVRRQKCLIVGLSNY